MAKYQSTAESLQAMKDIYNNAYENDPEFAEGWDAYVELFQAMVIEPIIKAKETGDEALMKDVEHRLKILFGLIGETYNPQFSYPDMVTKNEL